MKSECRRITTTIFYSFLIATIPRRPCTYLSACSFSTHQRRSTHTMHERARLPRAAVFQEVRARRTRDLLPHNCPPTHTGCAAGKKRKENLLAFIVWATTTADTTGRKIPAPPPGGKIVSQDVHYHRQVGRITGSYRRRTR